MSDLARTDNGSARAEENAAGRGRADLTTRSRRRLLMTVGLPGAAVALLIAATAVRTEPAIFADVLRLLALVSIGCALVGTWLVVRRMAMMSDAIGHSILFGIVIAFFFVSDPSSPVFIIGAGLAGILTVVLTEGLVRTGLVHEDAGIGMVFSFLFALALVIMGLYLRAAHVDAHLVLAGGVEFTVLRRIVLEDAQMPYALSRTIGGIVQNFLPAASFYVTDDGILHITRLDLGPRAVATMAGIVLVNVALISAFWKELKITTFDPGLAASLGFAPALVNYGLMAMVAVTAVGAFEAVGSILVVALLIAPPATAFLLTDDLLELIGLSVVLAGFATWLGFVAGLAWNVNFGGAVAVATGLVFICALILAPGEGLVAQSVRRARQRKSFALDLLLVHLTTHAGTPAAREETGLDTLAGHLGWTQERMGEVVRRAERAGLAREEAGCLVPTEEGRSRAEVARAI